MNDPQSGGQAPARLPQPPPLARKLELFGWQRLAIPLLVLIPLLTVLGAFGEHQARIQAASADLRLDVHYSNRNRYMEASEIDVIVTNTSSQTLAITVGVDRGYLDHFTEIEAVPSVTSITQEAYLVQFDGVPPSATRRIALSLAGEHYWSHHGTIRASAEGAAPVEVAITTFIFP